MIASLFATIVILKKTHCTSKTWPSRRAFIITPFFFNLARHRVGNLGDSQVFMENIFNIIGAINPKIKVDHT
jgi:hypothetical protein